MAPITNRLLGPKSLLRRFVMSPLARFCSTCTENSQLFEEEGLTASKDIHHLSTESNPPKLSEIFRRQRYQPRTPSTDTRFQLDKPLHVFKTESDPQKLVRIFKQSAEQPIFRSLQSPYEIAVRKLAFAKQFDAIEEILDHALQVSEPCSEDFVTYIIMLYGKAGMPQHAIKTFNQMKSLNISPTVKSFNALLNALIENKCPKLAHDFYKDMDSFGILANLKTEKFVVKAMCEMNEHESALTLLDEMRKHGCERHSPIYNTILSAFYKQGKYMEAADLLAQMFETGCADVSTYNIMMGILCESDKTRDAEKLLDEMVSTRLKPNISHFNTLIAGFCKDNNLTEAKRIFSDISRKGFKPDAVTYSTLISFLLKEGDFDMAYEYCIESMLRKWMPKLKIAKMLIDGLVKNNKVENARKVIEGRKKNLPAFCHKDLETISP